MQNTWFLSLFLMYLFGMMALSWWVSRKQKSGDDFLLAGRQLPMLLTLGTTVATMVGTGSSMGAVALGYHSGWAGVLYGIGGALGILLLALIFAPVRQHQFITMSEELSYYVGANKWVKNVVALLIFIASIGWLGAHILGGAMYLAWITDISLTQAKLLLAIGFAIYVIIGGYLAVVWTDTIQAIVLFFGFLLMMVFAVVAAGGWQSIIDQQPAANTSLFAIDKLGVIPALSLCLVVLVGVLATPSFRQRIYSGKSISSIRKSFIYSGILYLGFCIVPAIIGMAAFALNPELDNRNFAFPYLALDILPPAIGIVVLLAGLSATISSASSDAIAGVSILLRDVFSLITGSVPKSKHMIAYSRLGLVLVIGIALTLALVANDIVTYITSMIATVMSGLCVCGLLGRFWPRFNWQGALAALLFAMLTAIIILLSDSLTAFWGNPIIPSLCSSLFFAIVVSLITPKCTITQAQAAKILADERRTMEISQ